MDRTAQRRMIMLKSPIQVKVDDRSRCEDCGKVITQADINVYADGQHGLGVPRCCEDCGEKES